MTGRRLLVLLLALEIAFPHRSFAAAAPIPVVVAGVKVPEELAGQEAGLRAAFERAFARDPRFRPVAASEVQRFQRTLRPAGAEERSKKRLSEAREFLAEGKRAYRALDLKRALPLLEEARRGFIQNLNALRSNRDLIDAHLYLGVVYSGLARQEKASEEFRRVVYLDPKRELSSREFSPKVTSLFSKIRQEVMAQDTLRLRLDSAPTGAAVYLNGRPSGTTPTELRLKPGEYFVLLEMPGLQPWYQPVELAKRIQTYEVRLKPAAQDAEWLELFRIREGAAQQSEDLVVLKELGAATGANLIFLGEVRKEGEYRLLGQLFDVRTADFSPAVVAELGATPSVPAEAAADVEEEISGLVRPDGYFTPAKRADLGVPMDPMTVGGADRPKEEIAMAAAPPKPWYRKWWVWPLIGAAVAGIAVGAVSLAGSETSGKIVVNNTGNF